MNIILHFWRNLRMAKRFITHNQIETKEVGHKLAALLPNGSVVLLKGDLGAGKTTLVRGVAEALNIVEKITSPTFNIMKLYLKGDKPLVHIDAYRLEDRDDDIGLDEFIGIERGLTFIEWPDYIAKLIPSGAVIINIKNIGNDDREITLEGV